MTVRTFFSPRIVRVKVTNYRTKEVTTVVSTLSGDYLETVLHEMGVLHPFEGTAVSKDGDIVAWAGGLGAITSLMADYFKVINVGVCVIEVESIE
jgi:hypothetical protein